MTSTSKGSVTLDRWAEPLRTRVGAIVVLTAFVNESTTEVRRFVPFPIIEDEDASSLSGLTVAMVV
jgi:hypothetical protein